MAQLTIPLPAISADDQDLVVQTYVQVLSGHELMQRLDEELRDPEQSTEAMDTGMFVDEVTWNNSAQRDSETPLKDLIDFLRANGMLDMQLAPPEDYISFTDIHPLFRFENWLPGVAEDLTRNAWAAMAPALALSTKWLTTPEMQGFWHRLAFGEPSNIDGKICLARSSIENDLPMACTQFGEILRLLAENIKFWWSPDHLLDNPGMIDGVFSYNIFGVIDILDKTLSSEIRKRSGYSFGKPYAYDGHVGITCEFLYHLLSPVSKASSDDCVMMRLQFQLACCICHELAHALYAWRGLPGSKSNAPEIFIFPSDEMAEAGFSWSQNEMGGDVHLDFENLELQVARTYRNLYSRPNLHYILDDRWVQAWFLKDTWARMNEVVRDNLLRLPGAAGFSEPPLWVADRFLEGRFRAVAYKGREVIWPEYASTLR